MSLFEAREGHQFPIAVEGEGTNKAVIAFDEARTDVPRG
jgi:hypothetical protein